LAIGDRFCSLILISPKIHQYGDWVTIVLLLLYLISLTKNTCMFA